MANYGESSVNFNVASANGVHFFTSMLPALADPQRLITFGPALFARLEKIQAHKKDLENSSSAVNDIDRTALSNAVAEEQMLQQVLDWVRNCDLETNP